jgi:hypothetical protein
MTDEPLESQHHRLMHKTLDREDREYLADIRTISFIAGAIIGFVAGCIITLFIALELSSLV